VWSFAIGIPMFLVWVLGVPIFGIVFLYRNFENLENPIFFEKFRMIYQGLKRNFFYWEFVNIARKTFLVAINVFLSTFDDFFKTILSLLVVVLLLRVKENVKPYKNPLINFLETREYMASISTFYAALFFLQAEIGEFVRLLVFLFILATNAWYFLVWAYALC